jgi:hypothetical protein
MLILAEAHVGVMLQLKYEPIASGLKALKDLESEISDAVQVRTRGRRTAGKPWDLNGCCDR